MHASGAKLNRLNSGKMMQRPKMRADWVADRAIRTESGPKLIRVEVETNGTFCAHQCWRKIVEFLRPLEDRKAFFGVLPEVSCRLADFGNGAWQDKPVGICKGVGFGSWKISHVNQSRVTAISDTDHRLV
ncbi:MAG: hypothetical protein LAO08_19885 [Acidobacteriia bacterium]|nr:hypothetical protein [Terriglobia bacterium]